MWLWYNSHQDLFTACDQMSEGQYALPTLVKKTAIIGVRNIYDYPEALLELQQTFKRSLNLSKQEDKDVKELRNPFKFLSILLVKGFQLPYLWTILFHYVIIMKVIHVKFR